MPRLFEKDGRHQTKGLNRFPPFRAISGLLDGLTFGLLDFSGKRTGKETKIGVVNYKRGIMGASFGNFMRGAVIGALVLGALALTGGLAAVPLLGGLGVVGGALAVGAANATLGVARHGVEAGINIISAPFVLTAKLFRGVKNMLGFGGQQLAKGMERSAMSGPGAGEQGIMGKIIGAAAAAIATKMGFDSFADLLTNKISNFFGEKRSNSSNRNAGEQSSGRQGTGSEASAGKSGPEQNGRPRVPDALADKVVTNEQGEEVLRLSREDLADPKIREAVKDYGSAMRKYSDQLAKGSLDDKREAASMERKAAGKEGTRPIRDSAAGAYEVSAEHLMNGDVVQAMTNDGRAQEKANAKAQKAEEKAVNQELREARDANRNPSVPMVRRVDSEKVFDNAQAPQQPASEPATQPEVKVEVSVQEEGTAQATELPRVPKEEWAKMSSAEKNAYFEKLMAEKDTQSAGQGDSRQHDAARIDAGVKAMEEKYGKPMQDGHQYRGPASVPMSEAKQAERAADRQTAKS